MLVLLSPVESEFAIDLADAICNALPRAARCGVFASRMALLAMLCREAWGRA